MVRIGRAQHIDDGLFSSLIDFSDKIIRALAAYAQLIEFKGGAIDDGRGAARGFHRGIDHGMHGGSVKIRVRYRWPSGRLLRDSNDENERCGTHYVNQLVQEDSSRANFAF